MIKLVKNEQPKGIWAGDMKDGDIGVIVSYSRGLPNFDYIGTIVQRYEDKLITVGAKSGCRWNAAQVTKDCRVRLLEKGETLIVV